MHYAWAPPLVAAVANIGLALFVGLLRFQKPIGRIFTLFATTMACFNLFYFVLYAVSDYDWVFNLTRVLRVGTLFLQPVALHLAIAVQDRRSRLLDGCLIAGYTFACLFSFLNLFDVFVSGLRVVDWGFATVPTRYYNVLTAYTLVGSVLVVSALVHGFHSTRDPRTKLQLKFWLIGCLIAVPLGLTNFLPSYGFGFYPLGFIGGALFAAIVAYGILRHRLLDIQVVITKGIAYVGVSILVLGPAFGLAMALQRSVFGRISYDFSFSLLLLFLVLGALLPGAFQWAEAKVEASLFREAQRRRKTLAAFAGSVVKILRRGDLVQALCESIDEIFEVETRMLFLLDVPEKRYVAVAGISETSVAPEVPLSSEFARSLVVRSEPVLLGEEKEGGHREGRDFVERCEANGWEVCVPLIGGADLLGFLALGRKKKLEPYTIGDLEDLRTIGTQTAIALENVRLYEELQSSQEIINRAGRLSALGTLAAGIAHEIRNPLVSIQTFFQLAPQRLKDEEFMTSFLGIAEGEVRRIAKLIGELLSYAKTTEPRIEHLNLCEVVERTISLVEPHAREKGVTLEIAPLDAVKPVQGDEDQLKQVFLNIVLNAIQATDDGGCVSITFDNVVRDGISYCSLKVKDTGTGIPKELQDSIFNPFFTTKDKGSGLGLAVSHRIISDCGGSISVESEEGSGSTFEIMLPAGDWEPRQAVNN
jgi:signal transduction histidine kinase